MSSVATNLVATMMNSKFSALQSKVPIDQRAGQDFSKVFEKVNNQGAAKGLEKTEPDNEQTERPAAAAKVKSEQSEKTTGPGQEISQKAKEASEQKGISEEVHEIIGKVEEEVSETVTGEMAAEMIALMDEAMTAISELMGIPVEELEEILQEYGLDILDLSDKSLLATVVQDVFGYENTAELLLNEEGTEAFKETLKVMDTLNQTLDMDKEGLKHLMQSLHSIQGGEEAKVTEPAGVEPTVEMKAEMESENVEAGPKLEVVNLRSEQQSESRGSQDQGQGQNQQTFGEIITQQLSQVKEAVAEVKGNVDYQQVMAKEVIDQIVTKAIVNINVDKTSMAMQLNPEHLGKVAVSVTAEQGMIKGQFVAENHVVKEMLEANMVQLKNQLEEQGIKVDKIEVTIGSANQYFNQKQQDGRQQQNQSSRSGRNRIGRIRRMMAMETESQEVDTRDNNKAQTQVLEEHTVDYSA